MFIKHRGQCELSDICRNFTSRLDSNLMSKLESVVDYNTSGHSGHLLVFNIGKTLRYCFQSDKQNIQRYD